MLAESKREGEVETLGLPFRKHSSPPGADAAFAPVPGPPLALGWEEKNTGAYDTTGELGLGFPGRPILRYRSIGPDGVEAGEPVRRLGSRAGA